MKKFLMYMVVLVAVAGCQPDLEDDAIPWQPFDVVYLNLNLPAYLDLMRVGGYTYLDDPGVRGIVVYRQSASNYFAYERNCSFQPNTACATVEVHVSTLYMFCACCSSSFDFNTGLPTGGPAWRPLRRYETSLSGSTLTITDQIIE